MYTYISYRRLINIIKGEVNIDDDINDRDEENLQGRFPEICRRPQQQPKIKYNL